MKAMGIDPGLDGAIATWDGKELIIRDVPAIKARSRGREVSLPPLRKIIYELNEPPCDVVYIERNSSRPAEGGASGRKSGLVEGILVGAAVMQCVATYRPTPNQWKKKCGLTADKEYSRTKAIETFPEFHELFSRKKDHNRAEAALLAYFAYREHYANVALLRPRKRLRG